ncbi:MAG: ATP-binding cassette domain-containing protein [Thermoanaerobaculia bacterium]
MSEFAIETRDLRKTFTTPFSKRTVTALDGVSLSVARGEVFGLLGPNGAGKTTTVKILLDLTRATSGSASILGVPTSDPESRRRVGYLPEGHRFPGYLTARQTLSIFGRMSGIDSATVEKRAMPLLESLRIAEWADVRVKKYSKGMVQRLGIACALVHEPEVLFLDEPTDGVDPVGRREIRDILKNEAAKGRTIFLNSHLLSEIELMCDRTAILRKGSIAAMGRIDELTRKGSTYKIKATGTPENLLDALTAAGAGIEKMNGHMVLNVRDVEHLNDLIDRLRASGAMLHELTPVRSSLEDVFVDLVRASETEGSQPSNPEVN